MTFPPTRSASRGPIVAAVLSLLFHGAIGAGVLLVRLPEAGSAPERTPLEVGLVAPDDEPTFFTEQPADRAEEAPEQPDFLSNVDARARDLLSGGDDGLPRMDGQSEAPHVAMSEGQPEASPPAPESDPEPPRPEPSGRPTPDPIAGDTPAPEPAAAEAPEAESLRERFASRTSVTWLPRPGGDSDLSQEAMDNPLGNSVLSGEITLSTTAWDYAPWLQAFRRQVTERWHPPMAYRMGMIDGWVRVRLRIARSGELLDLQVLDQDVDHPSLADAVVYAVKAGARYRELPQHFPDEFLTLQINFIYPELRSR